MTICICSGTSGSACGASGSQNMHVHIVINSVRKYEERKENNNIQHKYYSAELDRPDWNREYIEYLDAQFSERMCTNFFN